MIAPAIDFEKYTMLAQKTYYRKFGRVMNVVGLTIESAGPEAKLGDVCEIWPEDPKAKHVPAEVVALKTVARCSCPSMLWMESAPAIWWRIWTNR